MTASDLQIPSSTLTHLHHVPRERAVAVLLRHSVRDQLPPDGIGYHLPITEVGGRLARELGSLLRGRLRTLRASPLVRCLQSAEALREGAGAEQSIVVDRLLGDPGVYVLDEGVAWSNWVRLGHDGVMRHLVSETQPLPGMACPDKAAHALVDHMLAVANEDPGIHVFVSHDLLVLATAARLLGQAFGPADWPGYLEGAFFWREKTSVCSAYRNHEIRAINLVTTSR